MISTKKQLGDISVSENRYYKKRKKKKKKKYKFPGGLGWGNMFHYGAIGSGTGFEGGEGGEGGGDGGGMGENIIRSFIQEILIIEKKKKESAREKMLKRYGIEKPEKSDLSHAVASIGKSTKDNKWYGWSHRAVFGFGIGDKIFEEDFGDDETPFDKHGKKSIKTDADAKLSAKRFARYVS